MRRRESVRPMSARCYGYIPAVKGERVEGKPYRRGISAAQPAANAGAEFIIPCRRAVRHQGNSSSCVGHGFTRATELLCDAAGIECPDLSPFYVYWCARKVGGDTSVDNGTQLHNAAEAEVVFGVCGDADWPDPFATLTAEYPPVAAMVDGSDRRIRGIDWHRIEPSDSLFLDDAEHAIRSGMPVLIGFPVGRTFEQALGPWTLSLTSDVLGYHCVPVFGVRGVGALREWRICNSWGVEWGDSGFAWIDSALMGAATEAIVLSKAAA
jgi:hypothetical protein